MFFRVINLCLSVKYVWKLINLKYIQRTIQEFQSKAISLIAEPVTPDEHYIKYILCVILRLICTLKWHFGGTKMIKEWV